MDLLLGFLQVVLVVAMCIGAIMLGVHIAIVLMVRQETGRWHWRWWSDEAFADVTKSGHERLGVEPNHFAKLQRGEITLTFDCMVCGRVREDEYIEVEYRPVIGWESAFPEMRVNVRYCNDNPVCEQVAKEPGPWDSNYEAMRRGDR